MKKPIKRVAHGLAVSRLQTQLDRSKKVMPPKPERLPLKGITMRPEVFQHRDYTRARNQARSHVHAENLASALRKMAVKEFSPVTVWWDGRGWACLDGHHRMSAYTIVGIDPVTEVPVEVFEGSLPEALGRALAANSQDKLTMTHQDKMEGAWRLTLTDKLTKSQIVKASGVSDGTVGNMRRVLTAINKEASADDLEASTDPASLTWPQAQAYVSNRPADDIDWEAKRRKKAERLCQAIRAAIGDTGIKDQQAMADALELYSPKLMDYLRDWWGGSADDEDDSSEN